MADEKKYTAQEAAIAVLKKTEEMLKSSKHKHIGWDKLHSKLEGEGYSKKSADKIDGSIKAKMNKSDDCSICKTEGEGKKDETMAGDKKAPSNSNKPRIEEKPTERDYNDFEPKAGHAPENDHRQAKQTPPGNNPHEQIEGNNQEWGTDPGVKGHIKLAHFMGHMSSKKKQHAAPAIGASGGGMDKPEVTPPTPVVKKGIALS
jgi:hypothetical protein